MPTQPSLISLSTMQENMAQPDPLSSTLRDFITLSQLCFISPFSLDHLIQHHQTEDAQAHIMPVARKITNQAGSNHLPESAQLGLKNRAFSRLYPLFFPHHMNLFLSHQTYRSLIFFRPVTRLHTYPLIQRHSETIPFSLLTYIMFLPLCTVDNLWTFS